MWPASIISGWSRCTTNIQPIILPYCPNYKNRSRVGRGSIQKILPFSLFLIPNGTRGVKKFRTEVSRVVHPEAALETPHSLHVLLGEVELVQRDVLPDPMLVLRLGHHRAASLYAPPEDNLIVNK